MANSCWSSALAAALVVAACSRAPDDAPVAARVAPPGASDAAPPASDCASVVGLVPSSDPQVTRSLADGATLAFDEARAAGGPSIALVVGGAATQWGNAAAETVRLACETRVVAVIAPPDRSLAHPVAQAATRCRVPVLSTSRAPSVTAAGSRFVLSVVPLLDDSVRAVSDEALVAPSLDARSPAAAAFVAAYRERRGVDPDAWAAAGFDAARVVVETVRRVGLSREAFVAGASDGTAVTGAATTFRFGRLGRVELAKN
jgi:ABC-type branched-subunit amino acid transport system substrate-binding protein